MKYLTSYLIKKNDPTFFLIVIAVLFITIIGLLRPLEGDNSELTRDQFLRLKTDQPPIYDMVVAGDSRILCDISPEAMSEVIDSRIFNFGFNFVGYSVEYLDAIEGKLDAESENKNIILGITPRSLTPLNMKASEFAKESRRKPYERFGQTYLSYLNAKLRPISLSSIVWSFQGRSASKNFYRSGLMAIEIIPPNDNLDLKTYNKIFTNNTVSDDYILVLLEYVKQWKSKGIGVFAFRPPVSESIYKAEETFSGFNHNVFVEHFTDAGGQWLEVDAKQLVLADGSHIAARDVPQFSRDLALEVHEFIK